MFVELNNDQRRETVNSRQRYEAWRHAKQREHGYRGSMVWDETKGHEYLLRAYYDDLGRRRQKSLGRRSDETEALKLCFDTERASATSTRKNLDDVIDRQAAINRALGLGRVPLEAARVVRALDSHGLLGRGLRVVATNALYAYEAASGVQIDASITATGDIDLLFDSRATLRFVAPEDISARDLIGILQRADRSFHQTRQPFRAESDEGYLVDLKKPQTNPPWRKSRQTIGGSGDIVAAEIEKLSWLENAPTFEQVVIDERGYPFRLLATDPRVFAIHKLWLSDQPGRDPLKRHRDRAQALAVAKLVNDNLQFLSMKSDDLRMLPKDLVESAIAQFKLS